MLSKENSERIILTGLYKCEPNEKYCNGDTDWCRNWTFRPQYRKQTDKWYMIDTYFQKSIELTDENFCEFELIFDFREVDEYRGKKEAIYDYDENDYFIESVDSGGRLFPKMFIKKGASKKKNRVLERMNNEINTLKRQLDWKIMYYNKIQSGEIKY